MENSNSSETLKTFGKNVLLTAGLVGSAWGLDSLMTAVLDEDEDYDEHYLVTTEDDHQVGLYRYEPEAEPVGHPVLLVHGLSSNHRNLAMDEEDGLAQYLRRHGYDCWAVDLRGRLEDEPVEESWGFDEYVNQDLPAAVGFVQSETGYETLHWIGHSMGGMAYLAYAGALGRSDEIQSAVTIGSPVSLREPGWIRILGQSYLTIPEPLRVWLDTPAHQVYRLLFSLVPTRLLFLLLIEQRITVNGLRIIANAIEDGLDPDVSLQFIEWITRDNWTDRTGEVDYRAALSSVTAPTLMIVGGEDHLCPDCETAGIDLIGSEDKRCLEGTKADREDREYDHVSLVFGNRATQEIFPEIKNWLEEHDR